MKSRWMSLTSAKRGDWLTSPKSRMAPRLMAMRLTRKRTRQRERAAGMIKKERQRLRAQGLVEVGAGRRGRDARELIE